MKQLFLLWVLCLSTLTAFSQNKTRYIKADALNLRETESTTAKIIATLKKGDTVELLGYKSAPTTVKGNKGSWVKVSSGGKQGYLFDYHLSETNLKTADVAPVFKPTKTFKADRADLHESLKVQFLGKGQIAYEVSMVNGDCTEFVYRGVATERKGDAESDEDKDGNGFFVAEYVDNKNGKCGVNIRIGVDKGFTNRARFIIYDCDKMPNYCKTKKESESLFYP